MKNLIQAMVDAAQEMPSLAKTAVNQFGGFSYVPIDTYYQQISPVLYRHGLVWTISEGRPPTILDKKAMIFHYRCDMMHVSGEHLGIEISIPHPIQGAQTAGSAMSYAAKCLLRSTFSLVTGEPDADGLDPKSFAVVDPQRQAETAAPVPPTSGAANVRAGGVSSPPAASPPAAVHPPAAVGGRTEARDTGRDVNAGEMDPILDHWYDGNLPVLIDPQNDVGFPWSLARDVLIQGAPYVDTYDRLLAWWQANIAVMDQMKGHDPESHRAVVKAFEARRHELTQKTKP